ncbi:hypothetical protein BDN72DRAFT_192511 [Pluteus cervinus]|uniref:Uncharacterized protein n=1 Tax=Pluteus cervinus TaxID=181527 RepID=A0ACD3AI51_9AGAR|nr:hypothetical protein BDN72DRAFT_192511 [Pluteus cervinus]
MSAGRTNNAWRCFTRMLMVTSSTASTTCLPCLSTIFFRKGQNLPDNKQTCSSQLFATFELSESRSSRPRQKRASFRHCGA